MVGDWIFDSTVMICCANAPPLAGLLAVHFKGRAHLAREVTRELDRGSAGPIYRRFSWFSEETLVLEGDLSEFADLRRRWGSAPGADQGEAASIILARRHGWTFVTDDGVAYWQAGRRGICTTRTPQLLVAMVRAGWIPVDEAWSGLEVLRAAGHHFGRLAWSRADFSTLCALKTFDTC
jgi:hypothetical protein